MKDEMDILREVGSIAAAHGSIALSEMLGKKINLNLPSLDIISAETIINKLTPEKIVICVYSQMLTGLKGNILFLLDEASSFKLIDACYNLKSKNKKNGILTEMGISVIKEVGSVVISSYIVALSMILKKMIIPSVPTLLNGPVAQIMNISTAPFAKEEYLLLIEAIFEEPQQNIKGCFYLVLNPQVVKEILSICKKLLESLEKG